MATNTTPDQIASLLPHAQMVCARQLQGWSTDTHDDCAQEAIMRAITRRASFDPGRGTLRTWVGLIARQAASDYRRKAHAHHTHLPIDTSDASGGGVGLQLTSHTTTPAVAYERRETIARIMATLSERDRIIVTRIAEGYTATEIASETGVSQSRISKMRKAIAERARSLG